MNNEVIRQAAREKRVKLWQIADSLGINDGNFSRMLRHELQDSEKANILKIIDQIAEKKEGNNG